MELILDTLEVFLDGGQFLLIVFLVAVDIGFAVGEPFLQPGDEQFGVIEFVKFLDGVNIRPVM